MNNYYALLGLEATAAIDEIKKAIHREQRLWSNRTNAPDLKRKQEAERRVTLLDEAEAILLDPSKRAAYDRELGAQQASRPREPAPELSDTTNPVEEARQLLESGRVADALYVAQRAAEADPRDPDIWWILGRANQEFGETERAIKCIRRAIAMRPDNAQYLFDLGNIFETTEDWSSAVDCYAKAERLQPDVLMYRAAHGWVLAKMGQAAAAIEILEQCVQQDPDNDAYQWFLAIAYADCAQIGWTRVGGGHPILPPGEYATTHEQVSVAQAALEKALALKFDDEELTKQLKEIRSDLDAMKKRHFVGNWAVPAVYAALGLLTVFGSGELGMLILPLVAALYVASTFVPTYIINRQLIKGKQFNDFRFVGRIADLMKNVDAVWVPLLVMVVTFVVTFFALPVFAFINLFRYQGDTIRRLLTSKETKQALTLMMGKLQSAASGTINATNAAISNVKSTMRSSESKESRYTGAAPPEARDAASEQRVPSGTATVAPGRIEPDSHERSADQSPVPICPPAGASEGERVEATETARDPVPARVNPATAPSDSDQSVVPIRSSAREAERARVVDTETASGPIVSTAEAAAVPKESGQAVRPIRSGARASDSPSIGTTPAAVVTEGDASRSGSSRLSSIGTKRIAIGLVAALAVGLGLFLANRFRSETTSPVSPPMAEQGGDQAAQEPTEELANASKCLEAGDVACAKAIAESVLATNPTSSEALAIRDKALAIERREKVAVTIDAGERCLAVGDFKCAREFAVEALSSDSADANARMLLQNVEAAEKTAAVSELLATADNCLAEGNAACVEDSTNEVLRLEPANVRALEIKQNAAIGSRTAARSGPQVVGSDMPTPGSDSAGASPSAASRQTRAGTVASGRPQAVPAAAKEQKSMASQLGALVTTSLAEGENCLKMLNFECAIARAETVLQFDPENAGAVALRDDAKEAQKKAFEESELK